MRSITWYHFQWPWTNPNPVFKVRPFFDAKYIPNGYRYGHSYYRRRIGNRTQAFEWHHFQWHWVTSKPDFKVMVLLLVFMQLTRDLFAITKFLYILYHWIAHTRVGIIQDPRVIMQDPYPIDYAYALLYRLRPRTSLAYRIPSHSILRDTMIYYRML